MYKFQQRNTSNMKKSGNRSPPKVNNSIVKDLRDSEVDEISNNELKGMI
jgi:hypothetical protein